MDFGEREQIFTTAQNRTLSLIPHIVAPFSLMGSSLIIYFVLTHRPSLLGNSYDRIMLGLSTMDAIGSFGFAAFGAWSVPEYVDFVVGAKSPNHRACDTAGWFMQQYIGSILYTAALMVYFILLVRLEWTPRRIAKRVEPWLHLVAIALPILTATFAVAQDYMNPFEALPGICWITPFPPDCLRSETDNIECVRGEGGLAFARSTGGFAAFLTITIVIVAMILLYRKARMTEERLQRYQHPGASPNHAAHERTRRIAQRGLCYIAAFFVTCIPASVFQFIDVTNRRGLQFAVSFLILVFIPLQGFFNAIIYFHPRWKELKAEGYSVVRVVEWIFCCSRIQGQHHAEREPDAAATTTTAHIPTTTILNPKQTILVCSSSSTTATTQPEKQQTATTHPLPPLQEQVDAPSQEKPALVIDNASLVGDVNVQPSTKDDGI